MSENSKVCFSLNLITILKRLRKSLIVHFLELPYSIPPRKIHTEAFWFFLNGLL